MIHHNVSITKVSQESLVSKLAMG